MRWRTSKHTMSWGTRWSQNSGESKGLVRWPLLVATFAVLPIGCSSDAGPTNGSSVSPLAFEVNPFIGTDLEGQTLPGALVPWGMVSASPHTRLMTFEDVIAGVDYLEGGFSYSGYKWGDSTIHGFGTAHLSGVGCPDLGGPVLVPFAGEPPADFDAAGSRYGDEKAHAGYYSVYLNDPATLAEMTATPRTGVFRFRFDQPSAAPGLLFDTANGLSILYDGGHVRIVSDHEIEGFANFGMFCGPNNKGRIHFVARIEGPVSGSGVLDDGRVVQDREATGMVGAFVRFSEDLDEPVTVNIGLSWVSIEGARANLEAEIRGFDAALAQAERSWQDVLARVEVEGGREEDRMAFFTALYHAAIHPNLASDVDGAYLRFPDATPAFTDPTEPRYTVFSLWDTYRVLHPLLALIYPEQQLAMLRSLADMSASGAPPKWELWGEEVQMMVGDPTAIVIADSLAKGLDDFDVAGLFSVLYAASTNPNHRPGIKSYLARGYIPMEEAGAPIFGGLWGPAATTLEYAFADWALAQIAEHLGDKERADELYKRALGYRTLYDEETATLRPRMEDGSFLDPYDPDEFISDATVGSGGPGFVEGTAWQYAFMVPHDIEGLIGLHGGPARFIERLEAVFEKDRFTVFNEPDLGYPYLFTYVDGEAHQTQREVRHALAEHFGDGPDGIKGNDDTGTMSAWFVFSALGFYPSTPGLAEYRIGSPLFERVTLHLSETHYAGATFVLEAPGNAADTVYVTKSTLNGTPLKTPVLLHQAVVRGGTLRLEMSSQP